MNVTFALTPYGRYLLASGQVCWGITPLVTVSPDKTMYATENDQSPSDQSMSSPLVQPVPVGGLSVAYNSAAQRVELLAAHVVVYFASGYTAPVTAYLGRAERTLTSYLFRPMVSILFSATPTDPIAAASTVLVYPTGGVIATL